MKIKLQKQDAFIILAFVMMLILFISSSMTYHQQTSVPFLEKYLTGKPFETFLERFSLDYSGSEISIQAVGYYKFLEFFIRKGAHSFRKFSLSGNQRSHERKVVGSIFVRVGFPWICGNR